jgi:cholesterol oxidase
MLSISWGQRKQKYNFVVVGSGYGGSITAARISAIQPAHTTCLLERGKEWAVGDFPDDIPSILLNTRSDLNKLGLYEFLTYKDISIIKGSGLGGTSLINANVALIPDADLFERGGWPKDIRYPELLRLLRTSAFDAGRTAGSQCQQPAQGPGLGQARRPAWNGCPTPKCGS